MSKNVVTYWGAMPVSRDLLADIEDANAEHAAAMEFARSLLAQASITRKDDTDD